MKEIKKYSWILILLGASILIGLGLFLKLSGDTGEKIILTIVGITIIVFGIVRLFPTIRYNNNSFVLRVLVFEVILNIVVGSFLIYAGQQNDLEIDNFFKYILGGVLYIRGFISLFLISKQIDKYEIISFLGNVIFLTVGTYVLTTKEFTPATLITLFLFTSVISGGYLFYLGGKQYKKYRESFVKTEIEKSILDEKSIKLPPRDDDSDKPNIVA